MNRANLILAAMLALTMAGEARGDIQVDIPVSATLPTENVDGSPLTDLASIEFYYGFGSGDYGIGVTSIQPETAAPGPGEVVSIVVRLTIPNKSTVYFAARAVDTAGNLSELSNEVAKGPFVQVDDLVPSAPGLTVGEPVVTDCPPGWKCVVDPAGN